MLCFLFFPLIANGKVDTDSICLSMKYLEDGLIKKEVVIARKSFAFDFSISVYSLPFASDLLKEILSSMIFESVRKDWKGMKKKGDITYLPVSFVLAGGKEEQSMVAFDRFGKILFVDYFDRLFGDSRYRKSMLVAKIPFRVEQGSIILSARLNESPRVMSFLLDTGADGMAIRRSLADSIGVKSAYSQQANVVGGRQTIQVSSDNVLHLSDSFSIKRQNIALFDKVHHGMDGIIGLGLLRKYITEVNFDKGIISFYTFGDYRFQGKGQIVSVRTPRLIILPSELNLTGDKVIPARFIMDTGANYYLIAFSRFVRKNRLLLSGFKPERSGTTVSLGHATPVYYGRAKMLKVGRLTEKDVQVTLQASTGNDSSTDDGVDGSVGIQFFNRYNFTVDLLRKVVHLSPRTYKK